MRKIIIAICGIILTGGVDAAPNNYYEPTESSYADYWLGENNRTYGVSITDMYKNLDKQLGKNNLGGTRKDEGAIVIWAARNIYEHGVKICPVQIQAANANLSHYVWLDYYWKDSWNCVTFCEKGYSGVGCKDTSVKCPPKVPGTNLVIRKPNTLGDLPDLIGRAWYENRHTNVMDVLSFINEKSGESVAEKQTHHVVLGVVDTVTDGVIVAPVRIIGERTSTFHNVVGGINSWIVSALSNGDDTLLCTNGYIPNNEGTKCITNPSCSTVSALNWCPGWDDFNEEVHVEIKSGNCKKYECIEDGYGFNGINDRTCVKCDESLKSGVNSSGVCEKCKTGEYFNGSECTSQGVIQRTMQDLIYGVRHKFNCWMEMGGDAYKECVNCSEGETYNKSTKQCE